MLVEAVIEVGLDQLGGAYGFAARDREPDLRASGTRGRVRAGDDARGETAAHEDALELAHRFERAAGDDRASIVHG